MAVAFLRSLWTVRSLRSLRAYPAFVCDFGVLAGVAVRGIRGAGRRR